MACSPCSGARSSRTSTRVRPAALRSAASSHEQQQRRDAVLVPHVLGVAAVAERLLVAEGQPGHPADPLEAGQRLDVRLAGGGRHPAEQGRGDDRGRAGAGAAAGHQVVGEQRADLVAAQHPPAVAGRDRGRAPVGVRVVGDHQVGAVLRGQRQRQVHGARLLRVGEGDGREVRVGLAPAARPPAAARSRRSRAPATPTCRRRRAAACRRGRGPAGPSAARLGDGVEVARRRCRSPSTVAAGRRGARRPARRRASIRAAIPASAGGTIWLPSPR